MDILPPPTHDFFGYFLGISIMIIGFFTKRTVEDVDDLRLRTHKNELDLANYKTEAATTFAKDQTIQSSLSRIHERIDEGNQLNENKLKEIRDDVKSLLRTNKT